MIVNEPVKPTYWFKHILFLDHHTSVCHQPELLKSEFVYVDFDASGPGCQKCLDVLMAHNKGIDMMGMDQALAGSRLIAHLPEPLTYSIPVENPVSFARGLMYAAVIAFVMWATLIILLRFGM